MTKEQQCIREGVYSHLSKFLVLNSAEKEIKKKKLNQWFYITTVNKDKETLDRTILKRFIRLINLYKL